MPSAWITSAPVGTGVLEAGPIAEIRSPTITTTASRSGSPPSISTTLAPTMALTSESVDCAIAPTAVDNTKTRMLASFRISNTSCPEPLLKPWG